jgi:hypothetical protein
LLSVGGAEPLDKAPIDGLEPMQRRRCLGYLHLGGREDVCLRVLREPASEERLAAAVLAIARIDAAILAICSRPPITRCV